MASGAWVLVRDTFIITSKREHRIQKQQQQQVSVRHRDGRTAPSHITVTAKGNIVVGKEYVLTYVGPSPGSM